MDVLQDLAAGTHGHVTWSTAFADAKDNKVQIFKFGISMKHQMA